MKPLLLTAALALAAIGLAPVAAEVAQRTTTTVVTPAPRGTVVKTTSVRRVETRRTTNIPQRRKVCKTRYRNGKRYRSCRTRWS